MKWLCGLSILACVAGCGSASDAERYLPSEPAARGALELALSAWKSGQPPGTLTNPSSDDLPGDYSPSVQFVDSSRQAGQKLDDYEILGELASDRRRSFLVELRMAKPQETRKVRFCVVGIDPLWVFREEELDMIGHWACGAPDDGALEDEEKKP